jgi:hypothetical protein
MHKNWLILYNCQNQFCYILICSLWWFYFFIIHNFQIDYFFQWYQLIIIINWIF